VAPTVVKAWHGSSFPGGGGSASSLCSSPSGDALALLFETVSALSTVGLSMGVTPGLTDPGSSSSRSSCSWARGSPGNPRGAHPASRPPFRIRLRRRGHPRRVR
jgi:hypothetical protein